eukprot:m.195765 g.195765  ORF g.195765 m.195765 type:complete len:355 (-) comp32585_c0_seq1:63-1127(-)
MRSFWGFMLVTTLLMAEEIIADRIITKVSQRMSDSLSMDGGKTSNVAPLTNEAVNVLIVSEARSGSTLLTGLLSLGHNRAFMIGEPWHDFQPEQDKVLPGLVLENLFDCSFIDDPDVLRAVGWRGQGRHMLADSIQPFYNKVKETRFRFSRDKNILQTEVYKKRLLSRCHSSRLRIVKTIRLTRRYQNISEDLVDSDLKVIQLIRHPVAISNSFNKFTSAGLWKGETEIITRVKATCSRFARAIANIKRQVQPKNIHRVRYEDVIANPVHTMRQLYNFVGRRFGEEQQESIIKYMAENHGPKCGAQCEAKKQENSTSTTVQEPPIDISKFGECKNIMAAGDYQGLLNGDIQAPL